VENYKNSTSIRVPHKSIEATIPAIIKPKPVIINDVLSSLKRLDQLSLDHPAVKYALKRKIPFKRFNLLYVAPKFVKFVNSVIPGKIKLTDDHDYPRLIIPFFDQQGKCFAFQGRSFGKEEPKYITVKIDESIDKIYGIERLDNSERIYIVEGPIDSLFLPNAIAVSGSSFNSPVIAELKQKSTIIYDNEPRSPEITKLLSRSIELGFNVCVWPDTVREKDINDMVLAGHSIEEILDMINNNTYNGAEAMLKLAIWRKC
jgi:hypothetical protein